MKRLITFLLVASSVAWGQAYVTSSFAAVNPSSASAPTVAFGVNNTAGNLAVVCAGWFDVANTISSVTDSNGNSYTQTAAVVRGSNSSQQCFYAKNIGAGSNTVTVTFSTTVNFPDLRVMELSGCSKTNPLDVVASGTGTTPSSPTTVSTASVNTNVGTEIIIGAGYGDNTYTSAGSGFTRFLSPGTNIIEYKTVTSQGPYEASATTSGVTHWVMQMATFTGPRGHRRPLVIQF